NAVVAAVLRIAGRTRGDADAIAERLVGAAAHLVADDVVVAAIRRAAIAHRDALAITVDRSVRAAHIVGRARSRRTVAAGVAADADLGARLRGRAALILLRVGVADGVDAHLTHRAARLVGRRRGRVVALALDGAARIGCAVVVAIEAGQPWS